MEDWEKESRLHVEGLGFRGSGSGLFLKIGNRGTNPHCRTYIFAIRMSVPSSFHVS